MAGWLTNGMGQAGSAQYPQATLAALFPIDTEQPAGAIPQTVALSLGQLMGLIGTVTGNTATSTVHAATLNTSAGLITTEALTTAVGATYTFMLTNSLVTASGPPVGVVMSSGTNTGGIITLTSVTNAAGSVVFVWTNTGTTAFNGTMKIAFQV